MHILIYVIWRGAMNWTVDSASAPYWSVARRCRPGTDAGRLRCTGLQSEGSPAGDRRRQTPLPAGERLCCPCTGTGSHEERIVGEARQIIMQAFTCPSNSDGNLQSNYCVEFTYHECQLISI